MGVHSSTSTLTSTPSTLTSTQNKLFSYKTLYTGVDSVQYLLSEIDDDTVRPLLFVFHSCSRFNVIPFPPVLLRVEREIENDPDPAFHVTFRGRREGEIEEWGLVKMFSSQKCMYVHPCVRIRMTGVDDWGRR